MSERAIWIFAGLLGLAVAIALAILTSRVSQPPVGVPGEPVSAGKQLAPVRTGADSAATPAPPAAPPTATSPPNAVAPSPAEDDDDGDSSGSGSGGDDDSSGRGRGRGRGGDD